MTTKLIDNLTAASTVELSALDMIDWPVTVVAGGLGAAETISVKAHTGNGWVDYYAEGAQVLLTSTNNVVAIDSPVRLQFVKGTTSAGVTLGYSTKRVP